MIPSLQLTQLEFEKYCPSATNPEGEGIFTMLADELIRAEALAVSMLDPDTHAALLDVSEDFTAIIEVMKRYIACEAYYTAIPHLDLVLTPTGFGVVSNQNVAPASADRVERLRTQVRDSRDDALDLLIDHLRSISSWADSEFAWLYIPTLIWNARHLTLAGMPSSHRTKLDELTPAVKAADRALRHTLGPDFADELLNAERHNTVTPRLAPVISLARAFMCDMVAQRPASELDRARRDLIGYLDRHITAFPTYAASSACTSNHSPRYENKKNDSCYFF